MLDNIDSELDLFLKCFIVYLFLFLSITSSSRYGLDSFFFSFSSFYFSFFFCSWSNWWGIGNFSIWLHFGDSISIAVLPFFIITNRPFFLLFSFANEHPNRMRIDEFLRHTRTHTEKKKWFQNVILFILYANERNKEQKIK